MIGRSILHYEIEAQLGTGGMGVVYRARDTHLNRPVAVKLLKRTALSDSERRKRFVQEARTASALSHPNIVTIFDINSVEVDGETTDVIVMEFVPGQTLDRLIQRKGLRINDVLKYATQIAAGLAAAHAAGIVHRDLKPSNVMINDQGLVKLLDFGLAKFTDTGPVDVFAATESIHLDPSLTVEGSILGTVAYMSPEQAEAKKVDARSDIFSFGTMLYEMLTGRQAFAGDSKLSTLSAILLKEPPPLSETLEPVPPELEKAMFRCLRKEPERRWQSIGDLKVDLEELRGELESNRATARIGSAAARLTQSVRRNWWQPALAGLLLGALGASLLAPRFVKPSAPSFERLTFRRGDIMSGKFAPGGTILYSAEWDGQPREIFTVVPGTREGRSLGLKNADIVSVSSNGELALLTGEGHSTLARAPIGGGAPREILENVVTADWAPNGADLAVVRTADGANRLEYPIGTVLHRNDHRPPPLIDISPDGSQVAFFDYDAESGDYSVSMASKDKQVRILSRGYRTIAGLAWAPDGSEIWYSGARSNELVTMRAITPSGRERQVLQGATWLHLMDIAADGRVLVSSVYGRVVLRWLSPGAQEERDLSWLETSMAYDLSPNADSLVFVELQQGQGRNTTIYYRRTDGSPAVHLGDGASPALSPDSKWVVSVRRDPGKSQLVLTPTGAGEPKVLQGDGMRYEPPEWFSDGRRILFAASQGDRPPRTWVQDVDGGRPRPVTEEGIRASRVSPDGRLFTLVEKGKLLVRAVDGGTAQPVCGIAPGEAVVRWSPDGKFLFLRKLAADRKRWELFKVNVSSGLRQLVRSIPVPDPGARMLGPLVLNADASSYAYSAQQDLCNLFLIRGLR